MSRGIVCLMRNAPPVLGNADRTSLRRALDDLIRGAILWRVWGMLGITSIKQRYRRSSIGQFWLTLSLTITIAALGLVYSYIFRQETATYVPYLAAGFVCWTLMSGLITESTQAFVGSEGLIRQVPLPMSIHIYRLLWTHIIVLAHNIAVVPLVFVVCGYPFYWVNFLVIPGLVILLLNCLWMSLAISILSTRFRDLSQLIASLMQITFFVTPIMWRFEQVAEPMRSILQLNPLAALLVIVRDPMLGELPRSSMYALSIGTLVVGTAITLHLFARFRSRIAYWL